MTKRRVIVIGIGISIALISIARLRQEKQRHVRPKLTELMVLNRHLLP